MSQDVLRFWFEEIEPGMWWIADPGFDALIRNRFLDLLEQARQGELYAWRREPRGRLAEIIVLDQFSRNIYRNTPRAFSQDPMALALAQEAVCIGTHDALSAAERSFLLMPFMHSESKHIHVWAEELFRRFAPSSNHAFELQHKVIIDRFGRYPHRNAVLGRISTREEEEFLTLPGSSF